MSKPRVFLSHSANDADIAHALVNLLRSALNVPPVEIRCTSVEGHRLAGGAPTEEKLRIEISEAPAFVGLVSPASIESAYVLFELGARWGVGKPLIPLLAPGADVRDLRGPLAGMNALNSQSEEQLHQLVREVGARLDLSVNPPESYLDELKLLAAMKPLQYPSRSRGVPEPPELELTEDHLTLIRYFAEADWKYASVFHTARTLGWKLTKLQYFFDQLRDAGYLDITAGDSGPNYHLARRGRDFAVEKGIV